MRSPSLFANRRLVGAAVVSGLLLVPLGIFGGSALAHNGGPSAAQYQYNKVTICHRTHSKKHPWVVITISNTAVKAHLRHGDTTPPPCPTTPGVSPKHGKPATAGHSSAHNGAHGDNDDNDGNHGSSGHGPPSGHDNGHHGKP